MIYARVSTINHGQDVDLKLRQLRQFAETRGWQTAGDYIFRSKNSPPEVNPLITDVHKTRLNLIASSRFDRFASLPTAAQYYATD